jgi:prepilin-type N-terminal cleavage/methylation domain-containing protein
VSRGFTLLEVILALGIGAALLVITVGGLRVGLAAWHRGAHRAAGLDHTRSLAVLLERAVAGAFPYRVEADDGQGPRILFEGRSDRMILVTVSPPFPAAIPVAFTALSLSGDADGLILRQQALPNRVALDVLEPVLVDAETVVVRFRYLGEKPEAWQDRWDIVKEQTLPRAVEITLVTRSGGGFPPQALTVLIRPTSAP